jgi:hypothetical protein
MLAYFLGIGFLVTGVLGVPLLRKVVHERMLKRLAMDGAAIVPRFWSLSGLRIDRPAWKGEVVFQPAPMGGGRPGHLRLLAEFRTPAPSRPRRDDAPIRTGDESFDRKIAVEGDPAFAKKFLGPEMRELLLELDRMGGRILGIGEGTIEIDGPLLGDPAALRQFLELCHEIIAGAGVAAGG